MARKGKEPAGLRRYRLAQKRKKRGSRARRVRVIKRRPTMARRRYSKKRRGGKKSRAIPLVGTVVAAYPAYKAYQMAGGFNAELPVQLVYRYTGYSTTLGTFNSDIPVKLGTGMLVAMVAHKVANKAGVNRHLKKLTMGYLTI